MSFNIRTALASAVAAAAFAACVPGAALSAPEDERISIGWTAWADAEAVTKTAVTVLREAGHDVDAPLLDVKIQYKALDDGKLDALLMSWQPNTHASYVRRYDNHVDLGPIYEGATLGLAVPAHVPESEVSSISDLAKPEIRRKLDGEITGIDPNSGIMGMTEEAVSAYGLDGYEIAEGTGPKMTGELGDAVENGDWIVVTAWTPHWMFGAHEMRFLEDPKGVYGGTEAVHALVREGFPEEHPEVTRFLDNLHFDLPELQKLMAEMRQYGDTKAVRAYIDGKTGR